VQRRRSQSKTSCILYSWSLFTRPNFPRYSQGPWRQPVQPLTVHPSPFPRTVPFHHYPRCPRCSLMAVNRRMQKIQTSRLEYFHSIFSPCSISSRQNLFFIERQTYVRTQRLGGFFRLCGQLVPVVIVVFAGHDWTTSIKQGKTHKRNEWCVISEQWHDRRSIIYPSLCCRMYK
jgi:hypothetical protein